MRVLAVLVVAACSKDSPRPPPIVEQTRALANEICSCTTRGCAEAVAKEWTQPTIAKQELGERDLEELLAQIKRFESCLEAIRKDPR